MKKSVLFVDDHTTLCRLSCDILRGHGYHVVGAFSGKEALEALAREPFDLVVTDLKMDGMDGVQLAQAIHKKAPKLPIILVTAYEPVKSPDIKLCVEKKGLFPALLEHIAAYAK